jgi:DNA-binding MarR family transcriptional regulator
MVVMSVTPRACASGPEAPRPAPALPAGLEPLSGAEEAVIRSLMRALTLLSRALDADLVREQRMSMSEYHVLRNLSEAPCRLMRMSELAIRCDMSLSGMTRLVGKLAADGFVTRVRCEDDARGANAVLTDAGLTRLEQAWPVHLASVRRHVFDHLGEVDLCALARALQSIAVSAETPAPSPARPSGENGNGTTVEPRR